MSYMKFGDASLYHTALETKFDDLISIETHLIRQTNAAYLVDTGETDRRGKAIGIWVPKSMSRYENGCLVISEKFAIEKGIL